LALPSGWGSSPFTPFYLIENTLKLFPEMGSVPASLRYSWSSCPEATASSVPIPVNQYTSPFVFVKWHIGE
jgi:hypothetical protein